MSRCIYKKNILLPWLLVKNTQNVAECPLHYVDYAPVKFEVAIGSTVKEMQLPENT